MVGSIRDANCGPRAPLAALIPLLHRTLISLPHRAPCVRSNYNVHGVRMKSSTQQKVSQLFQNCKYLPEISNSTTLTILTRDPKKIILSMGAGLIDDFILNILSVPFCLYHYFCLYHFVQYHFVRIRFCPYHFIRYHFVRSPLCMYVCMYMTIYIAPYKSLMKVLNVATQQIFTKCLLYLRNVNPVCKTSIYTCIYLGYLFLSPFCQMMGIMIR